ncbi:MAG TPA: single-stranded DNA-binding protein [Leadbetterella sp.]|nr:single-stranded DNA-binding protein [Leadbetterella sp.]
MAIINCNLGDDPELKTLEGNVKVAKFGLATNETFRDSNGQNQTQTEWHNIVVWRGLADFAEKYLQKGSISKSQTAIKNKIRCKFS